MTIREIELVQRNGRYYHVLKSNHGIKKSYALINVHVRMMYRLLSFLALTILLLMFLFPHR
jgi:hypothetical protein